MTEKELNIAVAKAMGLDVCGEACCVWVEGESSVHVDSSPEGWMCAAEIWPVYAEHYGLPCTCATSGPTVVDAEETYARLSDRGKSRRPKEEWFARIAEGNAENAASYASDLATFGHDRNALRPVPNYAGNRESAMEALAEFPHWLLQTINDGRTGNWATIMQPSSPIMSDVVEHVGNGETMAIAICHAILSAKAAWAEHP